MKNYIDIWRKDEKKVNILLVDDRSENLLALESILTSSDYHLISVNSGEEALKRVLIEDIAVILLDVQMPGLDGFETAKLIKSREKSKHIPLIFLTAISQAIEYVKEGCRAGAIDYIFQPFHPETLKMKVEAFVKIYQYQEQIKFQNEALKVINETLLDTLVTFDKAGRIVTINPAITKMFGYTEEELSGEPIDLLVPSITSYYSDPHKLSRIIETFAVCKNTTVFPADIQLGEAKIGGQHVYICSIRDVTERHLLEEERFRKIFESTSCLVSLQAVNDWHYINVNKTWLTSFGYNHYDKVVNRSDLSIKYIVQSNDNGETVVETKDLIHPVQSSRIKYFNQLGELRDGLLSTEFMDIHGEECVLSVITDITDRMSVEKEMARLDGLNLIGEMASGIVHEVRNPMTTIRGFLQISKDVPSPEFIDIMLEELDRAHNIISEFLSISKTNNTKRISKDLNVIIENLFPLIQAKAMYSNHQVCLDLNDCFELKINEREIRQLILNLSLNGLDAMSSGGTLTIKTYQQDNEVILAVQDEGKGIKQEIIDKIDKPFFSTKENGTGLGLSICQKIVSKHDAIMDIKTSSEGTIFFVHFPI
ncbi:response regulator [Peribacillus asahii]|uniref:response regulator n=1 Tax=Peribacillus asahii TaxID=228899 RepID=UPI00207A2B8D|nr:response regulator [Peribacillus asahii]USK69619.1 response regulator [Peribacillus asahii]